MEQSNLSILRKCKQVIVHPSDLFEAVKDERGLGPAFQYLAIISLVIVAGSVAWMLFLPDLHDFVPSEFLETIPLESLLSGVGLIIGIPIYIVTLLVSFIVAGWFHIFAKLFRGKGDYSATYKAYVYASTPSLLFSWIPIAGTVMGLYSIYLTILGLSKLHDMSLARAFGILIAPFVIIIAVVIAVVIYAVIFSGIDFGELIPELDRLKQV